jgi:hypothetical protein
LDDWFVTHLTGQSSLLWAQDGEKQVLFPEGDWTWEKTKEYYYLALTSEQQTEIEAYFARTFRSLGHQMHLIQDKAVPYHVRNDAHPEEALGWNNVAGTSLFESWAKENYQLIITYAAQPKFPGVPFNVTYNGLAPISQLIDTDQYDGTNPTANLAQGLAEYTNANFFSEHTIFAAERFSEGHRHYFPYPRESSTNLQNYINELPETVIAEDGVADSNIYIKKTGDGENIKHFVKPTYLSRDLYLNVSDPEIFKRAFYLDKECHKDYANKLVPRAVGYSAALLDYFFRGELEVSVLPLFSENASYGLRVKIKNVTPTQEAMIKNAEDQLALVCRYTPDGANADGSEDKFITATSYSCREGNCDEIQYEEEVTVDFYLPWEEENRIGMQIYESAEESVKCMLVFKGALGDEETAVIGKYFTLGQDLIKFNEEWDNGLTGNHTWEHTTADQNPDNGTTSNKIVTTDTSSNSLIKDNVRYAGYAEARFNETSVDFNDLITPYTYLQFKIDDLSKTETSTFHWQALVLHFNGGRFLQMTQSGQGYAINGSTATYTFNLGADTNQNVFEMFQNSGVSIPDPFYIERIDFVQQLFQESQPTTTEDHQHMEVDYIRIIEEKHVE